MTDEKELVERTINGDEVAFGEIVRLHQGHVRAYVGSCIRNSVVVDDLAQEAFIAAFRSMKTYKRDAPLIAWLIGIARHRVMAYLRSESRRLKREGGNLSAALAAWRVEEDEATAESDEEVDRQIRALGSCVEQLPEKSAALITEFYFRRLRTEAVAELFGKSAGAIRVALMRVRQSLRRCIEQRLSAGGL